MFLLIAISTTILFSLILQRNIHRENKKNNVKRSLSSARAIHFAYCFILWMVIFSVAIFISNFALLVKYLLFFALLLLAYFALYFFYKKGFNARYYLDGFTTKIMAFTALIGIIITLIITVSILIEAVKFFNIINVFDFLFGMVWNPQMAMHSEQEVASSSFGFLPVLSGTLLITFLAIAIAVPIGIMGAIYLGFYANQKMRNYLKPLIEILAGIPTVVYGYFAVIAVAPFFKVIFASFNVDIASESALSAGFVMGIMIIPFILSLTDDALNAVPQHLKDGSLALGSTKSEMIKKVALTTAIPTIIGAVILAISRAVGETMIVVMAAGLVAKFTANPLDSVTTATAQIVTLLVGDQEFNSPKTLAAFALALVLFIITFTFNIIALLVMKKYKTSN